MLCVAGSIAAGLLRGLKQNTANEIEMDFLDTSMFSRRKAANPAATVTPNPLVAKDEPVAPASAVAPPQVTTGVSDSLLIPAGSKPESAIGPTAEPNNEQNEDDTMPPYTLVEYKDSSSLASVDMNAPFVLVDTKPTGTSIPTLSDEDLTAVGLTPANVLAFSAMAVVSAIKQPESCGTLRQYLFELPPADETGDDTYTHDDILGEQIVFIAMINHLFVLARVQNPSLPAFSEGYQTRMEAVVEMLKQEKQTTETIFGVSTKTVIEPLYNRLHEEYVGPIDSTPVPIEGAAPEPTTVPTLTQPENTGVLGVNSPSGKSFYDLLELLEGTPAAIVEHFTNALATQHEDIPSVIRNMPLSKRKNVFDTMSLPPPHDPSVEREQAPVGPSNPPQRSIVTSDPEAENDWGGEGTASNAIPLVSIAPTVLPAGSSNAIPPVYEPLSSAPQLLSTASRSRSSSPPNPMPPIEESKENDENDGNDENAHSVDSQVTTIVRRGGGKRRTWKRRRTTNMRKTRRSTK